MKVQGTNLSMTRGDSEKLTVRCSEPFGAGDVLRMTVREDTRSPVALQKTVREFTAEGEAEIAIDPGDTEELEFGAYVYDIEVRRADGTVTTLVKPARFTLEEEVTYG